jgi:peptidoglycan/LPS O-acetylase OafA/YrhL
MPLEARAAAGAESPSESQASRTIGDQITHPELALVVPNSESGHVQSSVGFPGRIPALDGLRGIAILLVLLWHAVFSLPANSRLLSNLFAVGSLSWSGVDLFFVLSGFLIGGILLDAKHSIRYFKTFYVRRGFRILPLYGFVTGLFLAFHLPFVCTLLHGDCSTSQIPLVSYLTFTQNFWMAYLGKWGLSGIVVTWSLAVEEQFYLTIPIVIRKLSRSRLTVALISIVIGAPLLRTFMLFNFEHGRFADYVLMPCRADALCLGVLAALLVRDPRAWNFVLAKRTWLYYLTLGLLIVLGWLSYEKYDQSSTPVATFGYSLLGLFFTCCLLIALIKPRMSQRVLCNRRLMELGGIAYCTYLVHMPLIEEGRSLLSNYFPYLEKLHIPHAQGMAALCGGLLGVVMSLAIAKLSWHYFEQPMLRRGHAYTF